MKKFYLVLLVFSLFISLPVKAQLSCDDLDDIAGGLDDLLYSIEDLESFGVNTDVDVALSGLTNALKGIANVENDNRLATWTQALEIAWVDMEREDFEESLDYIIERLDELYDRDCER